MPQATLIVPIAASIMTRRRSIDPDVSLNLVIRNLRFFGYLLVRHFLFELLHVPMQVFDTCKVYRICLNPKKCKFMVCQGKILGHIVSSNGISTNKDKIKLIINLLNRYIITLITYI